MNADERRCDGCSHVRNIVKLWDVEHKPGEYKLFCNVCMQKHHPEEWKQYVNMADKPNKTHCEFCNQKSEFHFGETLFCAKCIIVAFRNESVKDGYQYLERIAKGASQNLRLACEETEICKNKLRENEKLIDKVNEEYDDLCIENTTLEKKYKDLLNKVINAGASLSQNKPHRQAILLSMVQGLLSSGFSVHNGATGITSGQRVWPIANQLTDEFIKYCED